MLGVERAILALAVVGVWFLWWNHGHEFWRDPCVAYSGNTPNFDNGRLFAAYNSDNPDIQECHQTCVINWERSGKFQAGKCHPFKLDPGVKYAYERRSSLWNILKSNNHEKLETLEWQQEILDEKLGTPEFYLLSLGSDTNEIVSTSLFVDSKVTSSVLSKCPIIIFSGADFDLPNPIPFGTRSAVHYAQRWGYCFIYGRGWSKTTLNELHVKPGLNAQLMLNLLRLRRENDIAQVQTPKRVLAVDLDVCFANWELSIDDVIGKYVTAKATPFLMVSIESSQDLFCQFGKLSIFNTGVILQEVSFLTAAWFVDTVNTYYDREFTKCIRKLKYSEHQDQARMSELLVVHGLDVLSLYKKRIAASFDDTFQQMMDSGKFVDEVALRSADGATVGTIGLLPPRVFAAHPIFGYGALYRDGDFLMHSYAYHAKPHALPRLCKNPTSLKELCLRENINATTNIPAKN